MNQISGTNGSSPKSDLVDETLPPSELGTKEYWDALYNRELRNYNEDHEDEGTIWFEESNAEEVVLKQLDKLARNGLLHRRKSEKSNHGPSRFLDLGTGNGHMLFSLLGTSDESDSDGDEQTSNWRDSEMVGVDYSASSIELARQISASQCLQSRSLLRFETWDLLNDPPFPSWLQNGFDIVLDKGTFDAISLMPAPPGLEHPCHVYRSKVLPLLRPRGFLMITSCNWTKPELLNWFDLEEDGGCGFEFFDEASYPTFMFGGQKGQSVVTVVFRKSDQGSEIG